MIFKKIRNSKFVIRNCQAGMTYVELIVVLSIFATMSSILMFNYGDFQDKVDLKNLASDIASKIVEAQHAALSGIFPYNKGFSASWKPTYGLYFSIASSQDADSKNFIYFADLDSNNVFTNPSCSILTSDNECLDKVIITKNNVVSYIDAVYSNTTTNLTNLNIIFSRPSSGAVFFSSGAVIDPSPSYVRITITSPKGSKTYIRIYPSGRIEVNQNA